MCVTDVDCVVETQAAYIENLLQQIYVLENEVGYLYPLDNIYFTVIYVYIVDFVTFVFFY